MNVRLQDLEDDQHEADLPDRSRRPSARIRRSPALGRLGHVLAVLLTTTVVTMLMMDLVPGDPAVAVLGEAATPDQIERIHAELGLDRPFHERYLRWVGDAVQGDLGTSFRSNRPVVDAIRERLPVTLELAVLALLVALVVAIPLGVLAAAHAGRRFDRVILLLTSISISSPAFLTGLVLSYLLALRWDLVPVTGWVRLSEDLAENLRTAALPAVTLAIGEAAVFIRMLRADMVTTLQENYIAVARAKGMSPAQILIRHALRPSSFSLVTVAGLALGRLIGGAIVVETLFSLPGVGSLLLDGVLSKDLAVVQGVVVFVAVVYVLINAVVDWSYSALDPRTRVEVRR
ncbi:MAG: ABC transporter permease [Acidimicrobiia bacterium]